MSKRRYDPFRSPGKVDWNLFQIRTHDQAERSLDAAFDLEVQIAKARIIAGWPRKLAALAAFEAIAITMVKYSNTGAMDSEPSANVRWALRQVLRARGAWTQELPPGQIPGLRKLR